jgi:hypothetical protein
VKAINLLEPSHEHEFEATLGLPEVLPAGEKLLWQGSPDARLLARQVLHINKIAIYFGLLLAWRLIGELYDGASWSAALLGCLTMLPLIAAALGLLAGMAWLLARTSVYTLTSERLVLRIGVVLSITFNLPLRRIASASLRKQAQGGDIALVLAGDDRIAYPHLWPHARPWHLRQPQPMLRALPEAEAVAQQLVQALQQAQAAALATDEAPRPLPQRAVREPIVAVATIPTLAT